LLLVREYIDTFGGLAHRVAITRHRARSSLGEFSWVSPEGNLASLSVGFSWLSGRINLSLDSPCGVTSANSPRAEMQQG